MTDRNSHMGNTNAPGTDKDKSYAQVESFVRQPAVIQNSGGLKPDVSRPCRIITRFTKDERDQIVIQAQEARMTISKFVRLAVLKLPALDPDRNKQLLKANLELTRQGTNLNQIARQLNSKLITPEQTDSLLAMIARTLMRSHKAVQEALANGRTPD